MSNLSFQATSIIFLLIVFEVPSIKLWQKKTKTTLLISLNQHRTIFHRRFSRSVTQRAAFIFDHLDRNKWRWQKVEYLTFQLSDRSLRWRWWWKWRAPKGKSVRFLSTDALFNKQLMRMTLEVSARPFGDHPITISQHYHCYLIINYVNCWQLSASWGRDDNILIARSCLSFRDCFLNQDSPFIPATDWFKSFSTIFQWRRFLTPRFLTPPNQD